MNELNKKDKRSKHLAYGSVISTENHSLCYFMWHYPFSTKLFL